MCPRPAPGSGDGVIKDCGGGVPRAETVGTLFAPPANINMPEAGVCGVSIAPGVCGVSSVPMGRSGVALRLARGSGVAKSAVAAPCARMGLRKPGPRPPTLLPPPKPPPPPALRKVVVAPDLTAPADSAPAAIAAGVVVVAAAATLPDAVALNIAADSPPPPMVLNAVPTVVKNGMVERRAAPPKAASTSTDSPARQRASKALHLNGHSAREARKLAFACLRLCVRARAKPSKYDAAPRLSVSPERVAAAPGYIEPVSVNSASWNLPRSTQARAKRYRQAGAAAPRRTV